jgi:hypothetical protein
MPSDSLAVSLPVSARTAVVAVFRAMLDTILGLSFGLACNANRRRQNPQPPQRASLKPRPWQSGSPNRPWKVDLQSIARGLKAAGLSATMLLASADRADARATDFALGRSCHGTREAGLPPGGKERRTAWIARRRRGYPPYLRIDANSSDKPVPLFSARPRSGCPEARPPGRMTASFSA